jgi:hypothetical protein
MAVYADYLFYTEQFGGTAIAQSDFDRLARQASFTIDQLTFERAGSIITADDNNDLIERIQLATCAVAEEIQRQDQGGAITSERVGNYAVTYAVFPAMSNQTRLSSTARVYLGSSGLMFRGFDDDLIIPVGSDEPDDGEAVPE